MYGPILVKPLKRELQYRIEFYNKDKAQLKGLMEKQLKEIEMKIERIEERFILEEISQELFEKYMPKYSKEKHEIINQLENSMFDLSNLEKELDSVVEIVTNSLEIWELGSYNMKQKPQKLVFLEGIHYYRQNDHDRTNRVNAVFELSRSLSMNYDKDKKGIKDRPVILSPSVVKRIFEANQFPLTRTKGRPTI